MKIFCIIVTYNAMKWIDKCLTCLSDSTVKANAIVVDNCSKDGTISHIRKQYQWVEIIENSENRGFGQANNQGIEYAYKHGATHFYLLNQDAYLFKETLSILAEIQDKYKLDVVSPIHLNGHGNLMDGGFFLYSVLQEKNNQFVSDVLFGKKKDFYKVAFVNAAGWMLSRKTIEEIGGFDPLFFHYGEDRNYAQRLKYHNKTLGVVPDAFMIHDREEKGNQIVYDKRKYIVSLLREKANINGHSRGYVKMIVYSVCNMIKNLFTFKYKEFKVELSSHFEVFCMKGKIKESKKQNKIIQPNWLKL